MHISGCAFMVDHLTKFNNYLDVSGWFYSEGRELTDVRLEGIDSLATVAKTRTAHDAAGATLGPNKGFTVRVLRESEGPLSKDIMIVFTMDNGTSVRVSLLSLANERIAKFRSTELYDTFIKSVLAMRKSNILDIGGRDRSRVDMSLTFKNRDHKVTVLDLLPGDNVDVVGDAHELSSIFEQGSFDAVYSVSVFEHLLMPWKVALEMNKVMRMGGLGFVISHQTLGMHDVPWDFWRFSDSAWDAIFNESTGFRIVDRAVDGEQFVIPFFYSPNKHDAEQAAGHENSAVLIEKVSNSRLSWPIGLTEIVSTTYPAA